MSRDYGWKRFWRSREGTYSLADSGFLVDPEGKYGKLTHPNLMLFARLEGIPGLALLLNISTPTRRTSALVTEWSQQKGASSNAQTPDEALRNEANLLGSPPLKEAI